jgi:hypothetical protein
MAKEKEPITRKEVTAWVVGVLITVTGAFQAYVTDDLREELTMIRTTQKELRIETDKKIDRMKELYTMRVDHDKDVSRIERDLGRVLKMYYRREDD